jgi:hypothetical protein
MANCRRSKGAWLVVACAAVLLLAAAQPALAEEAAGFGCVVAVDAGSGELRLDDGTVLRVSSKTRMSRADGSRVTLETLSVSEDAEVLVRFEGVQNGDVVAASEVVFGVAPPS